MNAYELADKLDKAVYDLECRKIFAWEQKTAADMLRQQADRIAELEKAFVQARVANFIEGEYGQTITHPHKELSDEDILSLTIWNKNLYELYAEMEKEDMIAFARAVIKASRGEE